MQANIPVTLVGAECPCLVLHPHETHCPSVPYCPWSGCSATAPQPPRVGDLLGPGGRGRGRARGGRGKVGGKSAWVWVATAPLRAQAHSFPSSAVSPTYDSIRNNQTPKMLCAATILSSSHILTHFVPFMSRSCDYYHPPDGGAKVGRARGHRAREVARPAVQSRHPVRRQQQKPVGQFRGAGSGSHSWHPTGAWHLETGSWEPRRGSRTAPGPQHPCRFLSRTCLSV